MSESLRTTPKRRNNETSTVTDIAQNRRMQKWTRKQLVGRLIWSVVSVPFFAWTPRQVWSLRRVVLRAFGAKVGADVQIYPSVRISVPWNLEILDQTSIGDRAILYALGKIKIGARVTVSQYAHICAGSHDFRSANMELTKPTIVIRDDAWICADAFVGPGVHVGSRTVVGARAVVMRDIEADLIVAGNPATTIGVRTIS